MRTTIKTKLVITIAFLFAVIVVAPSFNFVQAQEYKVDPKCSAKIVTDPEFDCNVLCRADCVDNGRSCLKGGPNTCTVEIDIVEDDLLEFVNIFGVNFGPADEALQNIIRTVITLAFALVGLVAVLYGLYGMAVRSTAGDTAEKVEEAAKIFQNAIIGVVISFAGILIIQLVATLLGISDNLFDFEITTGSKSFLSTSDITSECEPDGKTGFYYRPDTRDYEAYKCINGRWVPQGIFIN